MPRRHAAATRGRELFRSAGASTGGASGERRPGLRAEGADPLVASAALLGPLFAPLFEPIARWMEDHVLPLFERFAQWPQAILAPVGKFLEWLFNLLLGWIPDISWECQIG